MGKKKKRKVNKVGSKVKKSFKSFKSIIQIIIAFVVVLGLYFSLSTSHNIIGANNEEWYLVFFKSLGVLIPLYLFVYLKIKKEDYFANSIISILLSCFTALYISLVYTSVLDYINIQKSKDNPILIKECDISFVVKSNSKLKVFYMFENIEDFFYCIPKGLTNYNHLNNHKDKIKVVIEYQEGVKGTYIVNSYELKNLE